MFGANTFKAGKLPQAPVLILIYWFWAALSSRVLSLIGLMGPWGYVCAIPLLFVLLHFAGKTGTLDKGNFRLRWRRYTKGLPLLFALFVILAFIASLIAGGPKQGDFLEYRVPRMMLWLANGSIHWIQGWGDVRLNY